MKNEPLLLVLGYETLGYHEENNYAQSGSEMVIIAQVVVEK